MPSTSQLGTSAVVSVVGVPPVGNRVVEGTPVASLAVEQNSNTPTAQQNISVANTSAENIAAAVAAVTAPANVDAERPSTDANATPAGLPSTSGATGTSASGPPLTGHMAAAYELGINIDNLRQLMDMGFTVEMCIEALLTSSSLHQATDYLLNANTQPNATPAATTTATAAAVTLATTTTTVAATTTAPTAATTTNTTTTTTTPAAASGDPPDQEMLRLFNNLKSEEVKTNTSFITFPYVG